LDQGANLIGGTVSVFIIFPLSPLRHIVRANWQTIVYRVVLGALLAALYCRQLLRAHDGWNSFHFHLQGQLLNNGIVHYDPGEASRFHRLDVAAAELYRHLNMLRS